MSIMIILDTEIRFQLPGGKGLRDYSNKEIAEGMQLELEPFGKWFESQGNSPLIGAEISILRTYLAWKALYEGNAEARGDGKWGHSEAEV